MSRIGILGLSSIEIMGIKGILIEIPGSVSSSVEINSYDNFHHFKQDADKLDLYIVGISDFIGHISFFMPRKARTVILNPGNMMEERENGADEKNYSGLNQIYRNTPEGELAEIFRALFDEMSGKMEVSGELSIREKEVLKELARGKTNKEIADILSISVNTVITHRKNISTKLGIKSVSGLSLYALMNGVI